MPSISELPKANSVIGTDSFAADTEAGTVGVPFSVAAEYFKNYAAFSNPNLLDNAYWAYRDAIINQRGQEEYAGVGYGIDRWKSPLSVKVILQDAGIDLVSITSDYGGIRQVIDSNSFKAGDIVTFSVLSSNVIGEWYIELIYESGGIEKYVGYKSISQDSPLTTTNIVIPSDYVSGSYMTANISHTPSTASRSINLYAAKLELGSTQTLAHQDASGNWVLNDPPPNKALELAKCQRYYQQFNAGHFVPGAFYSNTEGIFLLPGPEMRANPSIDLVSNVLFCDGHIGTSYNSSLVLAHDASGLKIQTTYSGTDGCAGPAVLHDMRGFASADL